MITPIKNSGRILCPLLNDHTNNLKLAKRLKQVNNGLNRLMLRNNVNIKAVSTVHMLATYNIFLLHMNSKLIVKEEIKANHDLSMSIRKRT